MRTVLPLRLLLPIVIAALSLSSVPAHAQDAQGTSASSLQENSARLDREQTSNVPVSARQAEQDIEEAVRRFRIGVDAGVGLDPELVMFGAHGAFGPIFSRAVTFRPGLEFGIGEVTTLMNINLDVLYTMPGATRTSRWIAYVGAGPAFGLSHRGFSTEDEDNVTVTGTTTTSTTTTGTTTTGTTTTTERNNRFDFGDTDFNGGFNFIAGARNQRGLFLELKATAWGVSTIRMMAGFNF